jgi:hypothetical protein
MDLDPKFLQALRAQLEKSGHEDIPDALLVQFARRLQEDDEFTFTPGQPIAVDEAFKSPQEPNQTPQNDEPAHTTERNRQTHKRVPKRKIEKDSEPDEEVDGWAKRIYALGVKGETIATRIDEYRSLILDPPTKPRRTAPELHYGSPRRPFDPYPKVGPEDAESGLVAPPPIHGGKHGRPGGKAARKEPVPDYVPGPEQRRNALRWEIRKKLA